MSTEPHETAAENDSSHEQFHIREVQEAFARKDVEASRAEHSKRREFVHTEQHGSSASEYVKSVVFGGLDGIMTIFAIITAGAGAGATWQSFLVFGFSNVIADAFSMGFGEYIGGDAERDANLLEQRRENWQVHFLKDLRMQKLEALYIAKGMPADDAKRLVEIFGKRPKMLAEFILVDDKGLYCLDAMM